MNMLSKVKYVIGLKMKIGNSLGMSNLMEDKYQLWPYMSMVLTNSIFLLCILDQKKKI